ncbi:MAG: SAM-dependent methyltransferase [Longimicrobiales bacterium]
MIVARAAASPAGVARHYDELDPFYRELWGEHLHHGYWETGAESPVEAVRKLVDVVAARARIAPGDAVADVGCGYGATARILARERGARVTAFTLSAAQHAAASRDDAGGRVRFVLGDWLENALAPASHDAIVAIESTEHMADKPRFFTEAKRVLRPGGRLVVCAWLAAEHATPWQVRRLLEPICTEGRLPSMGTTEEYRLMMEWAGLEVTAADDITARVARTWIHCLARVIGRLPRPSSWRYLLDARNENRVFAFTVPRILLAYRAGAMRYGMFEAVRP